jgi:hypothetical protein
MMAATDDYNEIAKVIANYIEGAKTGNVGLTSSMRKRDRSARDLLQESAGTWTATNTLGCTRRRSR